MLDFNPAAGLAVLIEEAAAALHAAVVDGPARRSQELVPRDTETLANSMTVSDPVFDGDMVTVAIGYGKADDLNPKLHTPSETYAVIVHERLDLNHPNGGQAKFLEQAALEFAHEMNGAVAAKMVLR